MYINGALGNELQQNYLKINLLFKMILAIIFTFVLLKNADCMALSNARMTCTTFNNSADKARILQAGLDGSYAYIVCLQ